ncbi:phosphoglycerate mutase-like protein [Fistulina hepatica ATCC 64428]|uniref:Phosphoglycerate mutase-like protein n=1 Tax=Fistulina hepatica ATCC 64428 TaxID=1128425 RepID=A0A0D7AAJ4_9AGAR|nr:phosphoglycerate mutase-like protein [Fistulina hepatica ATCC 64428]
MRSYEVPPRFGLIDESPDRWPKLLSYIRQLNETAERGCSYKLVVLGRHGQGFHNVAGLKYGTQAWDDYWAKLNGDGEIVWGPDPELTTLGMEQARDVNSLWKQEISEGALPLPDKAYCSPLTRALSTHMITFDGLMKDGMEPPLILENCREENGVHTCDKRKTRSYLSERFVGYDIEPGFLEEDELWDPNVRETEQHVVERARVVLNTIFDHPEHTFVSVTAHSGFINGFLSAVGRGFYELPTGGDISHLKTRSHLIV